MKTVLLTLGVVLSLAVPCFAQIKSEPVKIKKESSQGIFVARFPKFAGDTVEEKAVSGRINRTLKGVVDELYEQMKENWHEPEDKAVQGYVSKDIDYELTYEDEKILSINFTDTFAQGDNQSLFIKDGMTFSKKTGKPLSWKKLVRSEDKAILNKNHLNKILLAGSHEGDYFLYMSFTGLEEMPDNYYVDNTGSMHFQVNPGKIGPFNGGVVDIDSGCVVADNIEEK